MTRQTLRTWMIALIALLGVVALAACGGGATTASQPAPAAQPQAKAAAAQAPAAQAAAVDFAAVAKGTDKIFISVDDVKKAYDARQDFILVDARPTTDFTASHIPGAISVPYFEVSKHLSKLPKDKWIVTYCGCPHAEAEQAARELLKSGYTRVKVIDEGYYGWVDKGWPVEKKS